MQNIAAPSTEAGTAYRSYYKIGLLGLSYTFFLQKRSKNLLLNIYLFNI